MPSIGDPLAGRYRIDARLGSGGMGTFWRAHDQQLDRAVALKVLASSLAGDPVLAARFDRRPGGASDRYRGPSLWSVEILLIAAVAAVVLLVLLTLAAAFGGLLGAGPVATAG